MGKRVFPLRSKLFWHLEQSHRHALQLLLLILPSQPQQVDSFMVRSKGKTKTGRTRQTTRMELTWSPVVSPTMVSQLEVNTHLKLNPEGKKKKKEKSNKNRKRKALSGQQTTPPRVALTNLFHDQRYPEGEIVEYVTDNDNLRRITAEELRHLSVVNNMDDEFLNDYRKAAEVHRQVRQYVQTIAKPGISMSQLTQEIEDGVRALTNHQGLETGDALKAGMGFPTGLCLNNVAAHWTPNPGAREVILQYDDLLKVDFGVHVSGRIVDSAFTVAFNPAYDNLLAAVKAATNTGLKVSESALHGVCKANQTPRKLALIPRWITSVRQSKK